ncbi:TnsA endonuclease N-terminal domain-containing protein [Psychrobium sp. 1_MG-2023]|uniref:TnsA endonuclease N-terminal domain-containing protein n=1 Tax=Psychrobium sp. 1_MG-2023 TaxID=3062624 RepID=UPI002736334A|nr:TnsA endonuclease N-terminal domain-containing protein [Psychrobium sp. 1_MG-2023]MDP2560422.1 TnsA endonuclease N-terminal domain-containing protein [Psychrobium sp. 1_MG-2023]
MGKRIKKPTLRSQANWYKVHRDSIEIEGLVYEPFWRTDDIPSSGVKTKVPHFSTRHRIVHLLSQNELWMYLHLVRNPLVLEIYEQFAIPLEISVPLAKQLEVRHPVYIGTNVPIIQTIDFVADMVEPETGEVYQKAFPVKQPNDALRFLTIEKQALQEAY